MKTGIFKLFHYKTKKAAILGSFFNIFKIT